VNFNIPLSLNLGLDAVQFIGHYDSIINFLNEVVNIGADEWKENPNLLIEFLNQYEIDIWFSTEGTAPFPDQPLFLDGDLLSASMGAIVVSNDILLPPAVPAGIPSRGVDFGLDAVMIEKREPARDLIHYSTEILYRFDNLSFTDGDVLLLGNGVVIPHTDLIPGFEPQANFLGLDALAFHISPPGPDIVVDYQTIDWDTGFSCTITITNNSGAPVVGWTLEFDFSGNQTIDSYWSCVITQTGQHVQIDNVTWNETIVNGGSVSIGFIATYSGLNEKPALFLFNGVPAN
jgi:cellulase/cellobiase CelA1